MTPVRENAFVWLVWRRWYAAWESANLTAMKWCAVDTIIRQPFFR